MDRIKKYEPLWGNWYVQEKIGEGSFGYVYKVTRKTRNKIFTSAVKLISIPSSEMEIEGIQIYIENGQIERDSAVVEGLNYPWKIKIKTDEGDYPLEEAKSFLTAAEIDSLKISAEDKDILALDNIYAKGTNNTDSWVKTYLTANMTIRGKTYSAKTDVYVYPNKGFYNNFDYKVVEKGSKKSDCLIYYEIKKDTDASYSTDCPTGISYTINTENKLISSDSWDNSFTFVRDSEADLDHYVVIYFIRSHDDKESSFSKDVEGAMQIPLKDLFEETN